MNDIVEILDNTGTLRHVRKSRIEQFFEVESPMHGRSTKVELSNGSYIHTNESPDDLWALLES
jgi:hypothetical protein